MKIYGIEGLFELFVFFWMFSVLFSYFDFSIEIVIFNNFFIILGNVYKCMFLYRDYIKFIYL